jgi:hypothetical protein
MSREAHWNAIYTSKSERDVSWFESVPELSLAMLEAAGMAADSCVIDVGGGTSRLIDALLEKGLNCLAVLDVSATALESAKSRLGTSADAVIWIAADVTSDWTLKPIDIWHDRAVFHFLTAPEDQDAYRSRLRQTLKVGGTAIIATFASDGPEKCSGLPVSRYSPETLAAMLGDDFKLVEAQPYQHQTPWGAVQSFQYSRFTRIR